MLIWTVAVRIRRGPAAAGDRAASGAARRLQLDQAPPSHAPLQRAMRDDAEDFNIRVRDDAEEFDARVRDATAELDVRVRDALLRLLGQEAWAKPWAEVRSHLPIELRADPALPDAARRVLPTLPGVTVAQARRANCIGTVSFQPAQAY